MLPAYVAAHGLRKNIEAAGARAAFRPQVAREASPLASVLLLVAAESWVAPVPASITHSYPVPGVDDVPGGGRDHRRGGMGARNDPSRALSNLLEVTRELAAHYKGQRDLWPGRPMLDRSSGN